MTNTRGHQTCAQVLEVMAWFVLEIAAQQPPHTVPVSEDRRSPSSSDVGPPTSRTTGWLLATAARKISGPLSSIIRHKVNKFLLEPHLW